MYKPRKAEPTIVYTPLPSKAAKGEGDKDGNASPSKSRGANAKGADGQTSLSDNPYLRAENEDDDGYDPYSDRRDEPPLFERNPWD